MPSLERLGMDSPTMKMQRVQVGHVSYDTPSCVIGRDDIVLTPKLQPESDTFERIQKLFMDELRDSVSRGLSERGLKCIKASLGKFGDKCRAQFGLDSPVKVES